uniref:Uncharacterized protein n=1 Tax=Caenorhabditis japonica TaxID=281687 RepID=A0A8R1DJU9_CAEJA
MNSDEQYRLFLSLFYPVFSIMALLVQILILFMIWKYTPKTMSIFRFILALTSVCQLILLFICFVCQFRMISNGIPVELRSYGIVRYMKPYIGYTMHQGYQFFMFMSGMSIMVTFYFKFAQVYNKRLTKLTMSGTFLVFHIPVIISGVVEMFMIATQALPQEIRDKYEAMSIDNSVYSVVGALSLQTLPSRINFFLMVGSVFSYPIIGFYYRHRILIVLNSLQSGTSKTRKIQYREFTTGLTIQAVLPGICYIPVFSLYVFCILTKEEVLFQQYFMYITPTLPVFLDPLVIIYFIAPYRNRVMYWIGLRTKQQIMAVSASVVIMT